MKKDAENSPFPAGCHSDLRDGSIDVVERVQKSAVPKIPYFDGVLVGATDDVIVSAEEGDAPYGAVA